MATIETKVIHHAEDGFLRDDAALDLFVRQWRECTLPRAAWTHAAHVAVAAYHAFDLGPGEIFATMKAGITKLNASHGNVNGPDSGYHETLTRFWSLVVGGFVRQGGFSSRLDAVRHAVTRFRGERDIWKAYYSFDLVRSRQARKEGIEPDTNVERFSSQWGGWR